MKKLLALALVAAAGSAQAATITTGDTYGLVNTNWVNPLSGLSQFDPTLGTLNSVKIELSGDIVQTLKAENTGNTADTLTPIAGANLLFRHGTTTLQTLALSNAGAAFSATAFDGTSDFSGTSGTDFGSLTAAGSLPAFTYTSAADLAAFIGTGNLGAFNVRAEGNGTIDSANGNLDSSIKTQARYNLTLTYDYTAPVTPIPEPTSMALVGLGALGLAAARRRK
ncbi:choice-of-anchor E domain-containing protein [Zoogloea sp.]|uniref:choice-of-anchor E domain-containing protein n=1 Tax=Zoogloea sp. TaxID=49181 RepID=UPI0035B12BB6